MKKKPKFLTLTESQEVCRLYQEGWTLVSLGEKFEVNFGTIQHILKRYGIPRRSPTITSRRYHWEDDYFARITMEHSAYWLGFLLADGSIMKSTTRVYLQVALGIKDVNHLRELARDLGNEDAVHIYHYADHSIARLAVYSTKIAEDLLRHGMRCGRPSLFPNEISLELVRHLIRGYFDGDGSVSVGILASGKIYQHISFQTPDIPILNEINRLVAEACQISIKELHYYDRHPKVPVLTWTGYQEVAKIYKYLYEDASVYLKRKEAILRSGVAVAGSNLWQGSL